MRVLLLNDLPPGPTGGVEVHVGRLATALQSCGCAVRIVVADRPHEGLGRALDLWDPFSRRMVSDAIRTFRPDVVHVHNILNELSTSVVGLGVPSVLTVHDQRLLGVRIGLDQDRPAWAPDVAMRSMKNRLARWRLRRSVDATIAPSRALVDALRADGFPSVHHLENFAPRMESSPLGPDVVFLGSLWIHKGPHVLLDAWARVAHRHPTVNVRIVGDGPLRPTLDERSRRPDLRDRVVLTGAVEPDAVPAQLRSARLVVVPSLGAEGGGPTLAVVEAMTAGRPVVVTDRPGVGEGVDGSVGAVVPAGDVPALAEALDRLLSDPVRLEGMGRAAAARAAERWSPEVAMQRLLAVYRSVAG